MKKKNRRNNTSINNVLMVVIGVFAVLSLAMAVQLIPITSAHSSDIADDMSHSMHDHMDEHMGGHHSMMGSSMMGCSMMKSTGGCHEMMEGLSIEEMDEDGDGICDLCGMSIEHCEEMMA